MRALILAAAVAVANAKLYRFGRDGLPIEDDVPAVRGDAPPAPFTYVELDASSGAVCLDGSPYGVSLCMGMPGSTQWEINIQGGGWCYDEWSCLLRSYTPLGSSSTWPTKVANTPCWGGSTTNYVNLWYCDGASFTGYREQPWPVPGNASAQLHFRGIRNLDASLDLLAAQFNLSDATQLTLTGGSAGGLSTFLHLDHVAARMAEIAPAAKVVGMPVCGFFLEHGNDGFQPFNTTWPQELAYVYAMQNSTGSLSAECQATHATAPWRCIMAPVAAPFVNTPWFALQSRFDHWQLAEELFLPCMQEQPYAPPYSPSTCTREEEISIHNYGYAFMSQMQPLIDAPGSKNGGFIDACIIHGSTNSSIDGLTNQEAFDAWLAGSTKRWWVAACGNSTSAGPCDPSPVCAPF